MYVVKKTTSICQLLIHLTGISKHLWQKLTDNGCGDAHCLRNTMQSQCGNGHWYAIVNREMVINGALIDTRRRELDTY